MPRRKYDQALPYFERALRVREEAVGPDHADVTIDLKNLGALYAKQKEYEKAEPYLKRALSIMETSLGPDNTNLVPYLNNLALLYQAQERYEEVESITHSRIGPQ